ncbi:protein LURP-one-related 4-like [Pistacia vera]|uniref:protein LURP-one-related 4-like n=1 Tax=Pistacia vera TaxID=55513 RepID=UPI00126385AE|nr:protein LURP-one-related 4-like [Pistacia vera]XP_031278418.1 protein LURP-one-related 4-like [Pistacia vera]
MAKVHPLPPVVPKVSSKRESFTIWMKSLVMQANGCTVYNENGEIVYRVDNYEKKGSNEVYVMDLRGKVLYTILRRVWFLGRWEGYKGDSSSLNKEKPKFKVTKKGHVNAEAGCYTLEALAGKSAFKIIDCRGGVFAEARRKKSSSRVVLGEDVLSLVV